MRPTYMRQGNVVIEGPVKIPIPRSSALAKFAPYRGEEIAQLNNMSPFTKGQYVPALIGDWSGMTVKKYKPYGAVGGGYGASEEWLEDQEKKSQAAIEQSMYAQEKKEKPWWQSTLETIGVAATTTAVENITKSSDEAPLMEPYVPYTPPAPSTPSWVVPVVAGVGLLALVVIIAVVAKDKDEDKAPVRRL